MTVGRSHSDFRFVIIRRHVLERDRPVQKRCALNVAIGGARLELIVLEARRGTGPMGRRAANGLDDPCRQARKILGDPPGAAGGARIEPGHLLEGLPLVVVVILVFQMGACLKQDAGNARLGQFVSQRSAARARAYDDDGLFVLCDLFH
ncbi:hypothetical protein D3C71_950160 [compost metagenome]